MDNKKPNIVILTGAGISAESGIQTFRASDGLWHDHRIEDVATPEGFTANPALVHQFYNERRAQLRDAAIQPNAAHNALAKLERHHAGSVLLVTQNVDNLHERAGSKNMIHMHGELNKVRCENSHAVFNWTGNTATNTLCQCCSDTGKLRPHIVWFGEMPFMMDEIYTALLGRDLFLSIGTSGKVYPAAGFVEIARDNGAKAVELNLDPTDASDLFHRSIHGPASEVVPAFVNDILNA